MAKHGLTVMERLMTKVDQSDANSCWNWNGGYKDKKGYGRIRISGTITRPHRVVLEEKLGRPILFGMQACHTCDNPSCCNPNHLYEGTPLQNTRDRDQRARRIAPAGEKHSETKISDEHVQFIRDVYPEGKYSMAEIAK